MKVEMSRFPVELIVSLVSFVPKNSPAPLRGSPLGPPHNLIAPQIPSGKPPKCQLHFC